MNANPPARRVRLGVVFAALACGVAVMAAGLGALAAYAAWRTPAHIYAQDFDTNLEHSQPRIWPVVEADPALRQLLLERTQAAFLRGGWDASSTVFWHIVHARMEAFAGDDATLICHAAWQDVYRALLAHPHACHVMGMTGEESVAHEFAGSQIDRATRLCNDAAVEGGELRTLPNPPAHGTREEHNELWSLTLRSPKPLPADEVAALHHDEEADDATWCRANIDHGDNLAAQPRDVAARDMRYELASEEDSGFDPHEVASVPMKGDPPADFTCAPGGTVFTLSMYGRDGRPITWKSLGRRGWDCALQSSASGLRGAWTNLDTDNDPDNALHLLWPLAVGKSASCGCGRDGGDTYRVVSYERYWLPFGWVKAYAIEEDVTAWNGDMLYAVTRYWSPELGFVIGQHTNVVHGDWPDNTAPDWQLVAMDRGAG